MSDSQETQPEAPKNRQTEWSNLIDSYKLKITTALTNLTSDKQIAEITNNNQKIKVFFKQIGVSTRGNFKYITITFLNNHIEHTVNVHVDFFNNSQIKILVQDTELSPLVARFSLPSGDSKVQYNVSQLLEPGEDQLIWRKQESILSWGTKGVPDLPLYANKWYRDNENTKLNFTNELGGTAISLKDRTFNVNIKTNSRTDENTIDEKIIDEVSTIHAKALVARAIDWIIFATFVQGISFDILNKDGTKAIGDPAALLGLINTANYNPNPTRPVDLSPFRLKQIAEEKNLYFSWNVYQTICTSLNLDRHLILTGPPGCGKSELAALVARHIGEESGRNGTDAEPKVVTASPSWTSGDLIGRYFPYPPSGQLRFQPGIFLQALEEDRCLVIDEMNRANLDECFGELFTVLAGHAVDLPYQESRDSEITASDESNLETVRIVPRKGGSIIPPKRVCYTMSQTFRLIGTMNDADRSLLHQLSFALLRRFDVVRVDPPSKKDLGNLLKARLPPVAQLNMYRFRAINVLADPRPAALEHINEIMTKLFFKDEVQSLIPAYVVGVATLLDVLRFILEGIRPNNANQNTVAVLFVEGVNHTEKTKDFLTSLTTLALILTVVPQLDALNGDQFRNTVNYLMECLGNARYIRLNQDEGGLQLIQEGNKTVSIFLLDEIKRATRGTLHADIVEEIRLANLLGA